MRRSRWWLGPTMGATAAVVWFAHLALSYAFVPSACRNRSAVPLLIVTIVGLCAGTVTTVVAGRAAAAAADDASPPWRDQRRAGTPRQRLSSIGLAMAAYFTFVMLLAALVPILVAPCA